jgi:tRNA splicing ligase
MWQFVWDDRMTPFRRQIREYKKTESKTASTNEILTRDAAAADVESVENNLAILAEKKNSSSASN